MNDQYPELYQSFQWLVPSQFNIAQACVYRWAENTLEGRRIGIYHEDESGRREVWTYTRLADTARQLANGFVRMNVQPGDRVAIVMGQRPEAAAALMAVFSVGAVAVPLSPVLGADALTSRLQDAGARVAIVDAQGGPDLIMAQGRCPELGQIIAIDFLHEAVISWRTLLARQPNAFRELPTRSSSPALLLYTPGTTGSPKGVLLSHAALIGALPGFVASQNWFPQKGDIFWTPLEWSSGAGLMGALLPTLYFGHAIVGTLGAWTPVRAFEILSRYHVSNALLPPGLLAQMRQEFPQPTEGEGLSLRALACIGEPAGAPLSGWCRETLGVALNETYGQTEFSYAIGNSHRRWPARPGSMGRPFPGHRVAVLDSRGRPCRPGSVGELALNRNDIHGHPDPALFLGYWQNDDAFQAQFNGDWYMTGDLASVDSDGYYWYAGRSDDVFKSAGYRIGPGEIEDCLKGHAAVQGAAVVAKPDAARGALVKAYVVLAPSAQQGNADDLQAELREHVRHRLASYQTPREIEFVDALPMTPTGKLRRNVLRARELQRAAPSGASHKSGH